MRLFSLHIHVRQIATADKKRSVCSLVEPEFPALDRIFAPNPKIFEVPDHTLVCRCECVTAGEIRRAVKDGYRDVNSIKQFTRCGMGPCQGRMCGPGLAELAATAGNCSPETLGMLRVRQPVRPVSLEEYCDANSDGITGGD